MENDNPVIYGLEFQTRALSAQTAETDIVRFLVGTQSLKFSNNQVHLVELNEETGNLKTQVFQHPIGEIWSIQASPTEPDVFITCYNSLSEFAFVYSGKCLDLVILLFACKYNSLNREMIYNYHFVNYYNNYKDVNEKTLANVHVMRSLALIQDLLLIILLQQTVMLDSENMQSPLY